MRRPPLAVLALAAGLALVPHVAAAEPATPPTPAMKAEAQQRFQRGVDLSREGDPRSALTEFRRAYALVPNYRALYNIGQVSYELQDYVTALQSFEAYLVGGGSEIPKKRRAEVEKEIEKLRPRIASATIAVSAAGAEVRVDDAVVGKAPLPEPVRLNPGKHRVTATLAGKRTADQSIEVAGGDTVKVDLSLDDEGAPGPTTVPTAPPPPARASFPWVAWGITGAFAVGAGVTGVLALSASSRLSDEKDTLPASRAELDSSRSRMRTFALATDILGGATLVTAAVATYLTLRRPSSSVSVGVAPGFVSVKGAF